MLTYVSTERYQEAQMDHKNPTDAELLEALRRSPEFIPVTSSEHLAELLGLTEADLA